MVERPDPDRWMTPAEAAKYLGISRTSLYTYMGDGRLPFYYIRGSNQRRIKKSDLDALLVPGNPEDLNAQALPPDCPPDTPDG